MATTSTARAYHGRHDGISVLKLEGQLRYPQAQALRHFVDEVLVQADGDTIVLDLRGLELVDSTALGLLARVGRTSLERRGRRPIIVCGAGDVAACFHSSALDTLFAMVEDYPFEPVSHFTEIPLDAPSGALDAKLGQLMLEAHRDLSNLSERNSQTFREVIAALEAEVRRG